MPTATPTTAIATSHATFRRVTERLYDIARWSSGLPSVGTIGAIETVRIDQWLHAVRLAKTRADAATAIRGGHVQINDKAAKPASPVAIGDRITAHLHRRDRVVEVRRLVAKRVGAAVAAECFVDHSPPPPERDEFRPLFAVRDRGAGRPTKRDRRRIDRLRGRVN